MPPPQHQLRKIPLQTRAKRSFQAILDATCDILIKDGLPGLTTNRVAEAAGVNIATLYEYFPSKTAIVAYLAETFESQRGEFITESIGNYHGEGWTVWYESLIDGLAKFRAETPAGPALRRAIISSSELHYIDRISTQRVIDQTVPRFLRVNAELTKPHARAIARILVETITTILDAAYEDPEPDELLVEELKRMIVSYTSAYLP